MKLYTTLLFLSLFSISLLANNLNSVLSPTAGVLSRGEARIYQKIYKNNGIKIGFEVGLFDNLNVGTSYGADNLVGAENPQWNKYPDFTLKFRIIDEEIMMPAIAIGVDTHGHGTYYRETERYDIKSKGAYLVASKNFSLLGLIGFDLGANYSFETKDGDKDMDIFLAVYKTIGSQVTVFFDLCGGFNDNEKDEGKLKVLGKGRGYLNSAVQWQINENIALKFLLFDMFQNNQTTTTKIGDRSLMIDYRWFF